MCVCVCVCARARMCVCACMCVCVCRYTSEPEVKGQPSPEMICWSRVNRTRASLFPSAANRGSRQMETRKRFWSDPGLKVRHLRKPGQN